MKAKKVTVNYQEVKKVEKTVLKRTKTKEVADF